MLRTTQKKHIAVILALGMLLSFMPALTLTAMAEEEIGIQADVSDIIESDSGPEAEPVSNETTEDETGDSGSDSGDSGFDPWTLATPANLIWDTSTFTAKWDAVSGATKYTVQLYRNGDAFGSAVTNVTSNS
ncbi:MAG TPA: hypothetical protein GXZ96_04700 [Firmicutes bacterium]|jgi:hypothetical protein|nr:hypothetical protein [Bacillota bacterium]